MASRAEFPPNVVRVVAERAGFRCSIPGCKRITVGPGAQPNESASIGTACHIYAASEGGPRGTGGLTEQQRQSIENAIWCCAVHGRLIDTNKGNAFPAPLLLKWKGLHEERIAREAFQIERDTSAGWINQATIFNSPLFRHNSVFPFSKATILSGGVAGKTAVCEWIAAFTDRRGLTRWLQSVVDLRLDYLTPDEHSGLLSINGGEVRITSDGKLVIGRLTALEIIYLPDVWHRFPFRNYSDDLSWLSAIFETRRET